MTTPLEQLSLLDLQKLGDKEALDDLRNYEFIETNIAHDEGEGYVFGFPSHYVINEEDIPRAHKFAYVHMMPNMYGNQQGRVLYAPTHRNQVIWHYRPRVIAGVSDIVLGIGQFFIIPRADIKYFNIGRRVRQTRYLGGVYTRGALADYVPYPPTNFSQEITVDDRSSFVGWLSYLKPDTRLRVYHPDGVIDMTILWHHQQLGYNHFNTNIGNVSFMSYPMRLINHTGNSFHVTKYEMLSHPMERVHFNQAVGQPDPYNRMPSESDDKPIVGVHTFAKRGGRNIGGDATRIIGEFVGDQTFQSRAFEDAKRKFQSHPLGQFMEQSRYLELQNAAYDEYEKLKKTDTKLGGILRNLEAKYDV